jgi:flagellar basal-body rod protein FlgC
MDPIDKLFSGLSTASRGLTAERVRMDVIAQNIANARVTRTPEGTPYHRKTVRFEPLIETVAGGQSYANGVVASRIEEDRSTPMERVHMPSHPDADAQGWVEFPNVNTTAEMVDLITAMRAYEANIEVQRSFVQMAQRALELLR